MTKTPSPMQVKVLAVMRRIARPCTVAEIFAAWGAADGWQPASSTIRDHLHGLERKGLVVKELQVDLATNRRAAHYSIPDVPGG